MPLSQYPTREEMRTEIARLERKVELMSTILSWAPRPPSEAYEGGNDLVAAAFAELDALD